MRLIWVPWCFALLSLLLGIGGSVWVLSLSTRWPASVMALTHLACAMVIVFSFVSAFRFSMLGTAALKRILAKNLAIFIAMELRDLRASVAQERGSFAQEPESRSSDISSNLQPFKIPSCFGDRAKIRTLLGRATEHDLEQLLISLESYNTTIDEIINGANSANERSRAPSAKDLQEKISIISDRAHQAIKALATFERPIP